MIDLKFKPGDIVWFDYGKEALKGELTEIVWNIEETHYRVDNIRCKDRGLCTNYFIDINRDSHIDIFKSKELCEEYILSCELTNKINYAKSTGLRSKEY